MDPLTIGARMAVVLAGLLAASVVYSMGGSAREFSNSLRSRLLFGLPVGTLLTILLVTGFFLFVQGGWGHQRPLTLPFTSWSLRYPLGMATAPLAHQNIGHLIGNLAGFLVFGTLAEYAMSHFPVSRGEAAFGSIRSNPYVRAVLFVPVVVFGVALMTSLFAWGPVIGFSGVGFAAVGFALVYFPVLTVVGLVAREFLGTVVWALRDPIVTAAAGTSYGSPWWANIAIQAHLLGLLLGVGLGLALQWRRTETPGIDPWRLFPASLLVGSSMTLWAVWWYQGSSSYQLFRGPGVVLVVGVALLVTIAGSLHESPITDLSARQVSLGLVVFPILLMGVIAVPVNLTATTADLGAPGDTVSVDGYEIGYGDGVPDPRFDPINISEMETPSPPTATGVIVTNEKRHLWTEAVSASRLQNAGQSTITVGGLGWREEVTVTRTGWRAAGGGSAFSVTTKPPDGAPIALFESERAQANTVVDGHELSIAPSNGSFVIEATATNTSTIDSLPAQVTVPSPANETTLGRLTIVNNESVIWVEQNETRVPIFERENS
jgi:membrane associated rhomboid family serine protease